jgi:AraC-like DNA-binding protein/mannose-6-phosphate isomerase-like protein (cupin superfamily)
MRHFIRHRGDSPAPPPLRFDHRGSACFLRIENASEETYEADAYRRLRRHRAGHRHDVYHILLCTAGRNRMRLGDELHAVRRGTLVCTAPGQHHEFRPRDPGEVAYRQVTFTAWRGDEPLRLDVSELIQSVGGVAVTKLNAPTPLHRSAASRVNAGLCRLLKAGGQWDHLRPLRLAVSLLDVFAAIADAASATQTPQLLDPLDAARHRIESRLAEAVSVGELARLANCSEGHFHRRFKARFGESPVAYQLRLRCEAAKNLLRSTDDTLAEVAHRLGFGDPYHFSRAFKRGVGMPPGRYRREATQA